MVYPDYQPVGDAEVRARFEALWDAQLDPRPGLTVVEIMHAIHAGRIKGMYIMGENPAMSDPNLNHARAALARLEHLVVQDIFFTETAGYADVILPASAFPEKTGTFTNTDRRVQLAARPCSLRRRRARTCGSSSRWHGAWPRLALRRHVARVFDEMRSATPSIAGMTWDRLEREHSVTYPCLAEGDPGEPILFRERFPTASGRARFVPAEYTQAAELPDPEYPFVLITGRQLEHWHTGSMTRHASVLDAIEPEPVVNVHPDDMAATGLEPGDHLQLASRRGHLTARVRPDRGVQRGTVFMAFCYVEAAANLLTNEELDPFGKIPEFKYCAVRLGVARRRCLRLCVSASSRRSRSCRRALDAQVL